MNDSASAQIEDRQPQTLRAQVVDVTQRRLYPGEVTVRGGLIVSLREIPAAELPAGCGFLMPGFIDSHVHIESSMLVPSQFAAMAVRHGTVATVSDPHEIANVVGIAGIEYMLENAAGCHLDIFFGAPSCVPATNFETAGAALDAAAVTKLLDDPRILYLSEMMNFPGVLHGDEEVHAKLTAAQQRDKPIDGHAPGLRGAEAERYFSAGPSTDHECVALGEAEDKLAAGALIAIREGSAARNFAALEPLLSSHPGKVMFCSDDKHPDELLTGHINQLAARALGQGHDLFDVLAAACIRPIEHYRLPMGRLRPGDRADFVLVDDLEHFDVAATYRQGQQVFRRGDALAAAPPRRTINNFEARFVSAKDFLLPANGNRAHCIVAEDGQLVTGDEVVSPRIAAGHVLADANADVLKLAVVNRYRQAPVACGLIKNFGLRHGAIASSVAHDSHNVIAVGADDESLAAAVNGVMECRGGLSVVSPEGTDLLPLPVAGLMATGTCEEVGQAYARLDAAAKALGSPLRAPFMTLSFMALLVIPDLKLSDRGLFSGRQFAFQPLFE